MSKPKPHAAETRHVDPSADVDSRLDEALRESFPASDPIAVDPIDHADLLHPPGENAPAAGTPAKGKKPH